MYITYTCILSKQIFEYLLYEFASLECADT